MGFKLSPTTARNNHGHIGPNQSISIITIDPRRGINTRSIDYLSLNRFRTHPWWTRKALTILSSVISTSSGESNVTGASRNFLLSVRDTKDRVARNQTKHEQLYHWSRRYLYKIKHKHDHEINKAIKDRDKTHTNNHTWCCTGLISSQMKCPGLHHRSLCLALATISNPQCGRCRRHHSCPWQSQTIDFFYAQSDYNGKQIWALLGQPLIMLPDWPQL